MQHALPFENKMKDIVFQMCARGQTHFVSKTNPHIGYTVIAETSPLSAHNHMVKSLSTQVVEEYVDRESPVNQTEMDAYYIPLLSSGFRGLSASLMTRLSSQKMADIKEIPCQDESPEIFRFGYRGQFKKMFWSTLQQFNSSAHDCRGLRSFCYHVEVVRWACPRTCGCTSPFTLPPQGGCPTKCEAVRRAYVKPLECVDKTLTAWRAEPLINGFLAFSETWPWGANHQQTAVAEIRRVRKEGCQALQALMTSNASYVADRLCFNSIGSAGMYLTYFCPVACGCQNVTSAECLPSCKRGAVPEDAGCAAGMCLEGAPVIYNCERS